MTEARRLRAQADRCTQLAKEARSKSIAETLTRLAAKSLEEASELERLAAEHRRMKKAQI